MNEKKELLKRWKKDLYIYDLMTFRDAFSINFNLFKRSFTTQTQSLIKKIIILPMTFPRAFLRLRYKYGFSIWHFLRFFLHEVFIDLRNTFLDIREFIYHRIRGHKVMKAEEMGKLIFESLKPSSYYEAFSSGRLSLPKEDEEDN